MENLSFNQINRELSYLNKLSFALESQIQLHYQLDDVSDDVRQIMKVTLENIDPEIDIKEGSAITLRALKEGVKTAAKYAREFIKKLFTWLKAAWIRFSGSINAVRRKHTRINNRLAKIGNVTPYKKITITNTQRLSINGEFVGTGATHLKDILTTTNYFLHEYPRSVVNLVRNTSREVLNINNPGKTQKQLLEEIGSKFIDIYKRDFKEPTGQPVGNTFQSDVKGLYRTEVLPSNTALIFTPKKAIENAVDQNIDLPNLIKRSLVMKFTELQMAVADSGEKEIEPPSIKKLQEIMHVISNILDSAQTGNSYIKDYETAKTVVDDAIRQVAQKNEDSDVSSNVLIHVLGELSSKLIEPVSNYTHWLAITLNVYLSFVEFCLNNYQENAA